MNIPRILKNFKNYFNSHGVNCVLVITVFIPRFLKCKNDGHIKYKYWIMFMVGMSTRYIQIGKTINRLTLASRGDNNNNYYNNKVI